MPLRESCLPRSPSLCELVRAWPTLPRPHVVAVRNGQWPQRR